MATIIDLLRSRSRAAWLSLHGIRIGPGSHFGRNVRVTRGFRDGRNGSVRLGAGTDLQIGAVLDAWGGKIILGNRVFVGPYAVVYGQGGVEIGDRTLISMHCRILSSNHGLPAPGKPIRDEPDELLPTRIGCDVWLGAGLTVLGGVTIGDGCVVGAGAVVTESLPANSVAVGVPAKVVRHRT